MKNLENHGFTIKVETTYIPSYEIQKPFNFFFAYQITIKNDSKQASQLVSRCWKITDSMGHQEEVNGLGVVGLQPIIEGGESFTYTSGCPLISTMGKMKGYYIFLNLTDQSTFKVNIPEFELVANFVLN